MPRFRQKLFKFVAISSRKAPTYTINDEQDESIRGKINRKELIKVHVTMEAFTIKLGSNASAQLFPDKTLSSF